MYYFIKDSDLIALEILQARFISMDERPACHIISCADGDLIFGLDLVLAMMIVWWFCISQITCKVI